jgi:hypothetical protein
MKRSNALIVGLTLITVVGCRPKPHSAPGEVCDAGAVFASITPKYEHTFKIQNTTGVDVTILDENHSCSCTEVVFQKGILRAGETMPLTLKVKVHPTYSDLTIGCRLRTDHPRFPEWPYTLHLESFPVARMAPERVDLGIFDLVEGNSGSSRADAESWVEIFSPPGSSTQPVPVSAKSTDGVAIDVDPRPSVDTMKSGVKRSRYLLRMSFDAIKNQTMTGFQAHPIVVHLNDGHTVEGMVCWGVSMPLVCTPARLHFGSVPVSELPRKQKVIVRSRDRKPFRILSVDADREIAVTAGGGIGPESRPNSDQELELTLAASREVKTPARSGVIQIRTDAALPAVHVPWSVFFR